MVDEFGDNELQKPTEDIKESGQNKTKAVATSLIVFFLSLSAFGFYAYQNGMLSNVFNMKSTKHIATEGEKNILEETLGEDETSMAEENLIQETILESENLESTNN